MRLALLLAIFAVAQCLETKYTFEVVDADNVTSTCNFLARRNFTQFETDCYMSGPEKKFLNLTVLTLLIVVMFFLTAYTACSCIVDRCGCCGDDSRHSGTDYRKP